MPPVFVIWTTINGDGVAFRHHVTCELTLGRNLNQNEKKNPLVYHRVYDIPLPERHRFPGSKYSLLLNALEREGLINRFLKFSPKPATAWRKLSIAHDQKYLRAVETGNLSEGTRNKDRIAMD